MDKKICVSATLTMEQYDNFKKICDNEKRSIANKIIILIDEEVKKYNDRK